MEDVKTIEFTGDPMFQIKNIENINDKQFYLNIKALNEIISYSRKVEQSIKFDLDNEYLKSIGIYTKSLWLVRPSVAVKTRRRFPKTHILIGLFKRCVDIDCEIIACILGISAEDMEYTFPKNGTQIILKQK